MTPLDYLNSVIQQYTDLKSQLIPLEYVTSESENNLVFFQDKKINELNDNQSLSYSNIGETLELIIKKIIEYVNDIKGVDAVSLDADIKEQFLILNTNYFADTNIDVVTYNATAYSILSYKDISTVKTFIDQINISNSFSVFSSKKNREVSIEPVLYYLDVGNNIVSKYTINTAFTPTSIWGVIFIGIKVNETIENGDTISVNGGYNVEIRYNDFNYKNYSLSLTNQTGFNILNQIYTGEVAFFNIIDLFGNNVKIRTVDGSLISVVADETINKNFDKKTLANIQIDDFVVPFSNWENVSITNGWSYGRVPEQIRFNVCKTKTFSDALYFPALTPLANSVKELVNDL